MKMLPVKEYCGDQDATPASKRCHKHDEAPVREYKRWYQHKIGLKNFDLDVPPESNSYVIFIFSITKKNQMHT